MSLKRRGTVVGLPIFSCIVALEDNTKFYYYPGSHQEGVLTGDRCIFQERCVLLKKGTVVVFHPLLMHAGAGYGIFANTRLHLYINPTTEHDRKEKKRSTYFNNHAMIMPKKRKV